MFDVSAEILTKQLEESKEYLPYFKRKIIDKLQRTFNAKKLPNPILDEYS